MRDFSVCIRVPSLESRNQLYSNTLPIAVRSYFSSEGYLYKLSECSRIDQLNEGVENHYGKIYL